MRTLLAAPDLMEFGWSLMWWIPHIRYLAKTGDYDRVIVGTKKQYAYLYKDFATDIRYIESDGVSSEYFCDGVVPEWDRAFVNSLEGDVDEVRPNRELKYTNELFYRILHGESDVEYDILIHARSLTKLGTEYRNWPMHKWDKVVTAFSGHRIACIGSVNGADYVDGTDDLRGIPIDELIGVIGNSKLVIGASSGTMHLASLCCTPQIVWTADNRHGTIKGNNRYRYESLWNPFNTRVSVIDRDGWNPEVETVVHEIKNTFNNQRIYKPVKSKEKKRVKLKPISMCMTTYNRPEYFTHTMESLRRSNVSLENLYIVDDNSTDETKQGLLRKYSKKYTVIHNASQYGILVNGRRCIDTCYNLSHGKWFVYCQDDIEFSHDWHYELNEIINQIYKDGVDWGLLSLCHFHEKTKELYYIKEDGHTGGVCWAVNRDMWRMYRQDNDIFAERGKKLLDFRVSHWCHHNDIRQWAVCHVGRSLVKHIGNESSLSDKDMSIFKSQGYVGGEI